MLLYQFDPSLKKLRSIKGTNDFYCRANGSGFVLAILVMLLVDSSTVKNGIYTCWCIYTIVIGLVGAHQLRKSWD